MSGGHGAVEGSNKRVALLISVLALFLALAETLAARVAPGGRIALSGIMQGQEQDLVQRYTPWFEHLHCEYDAEWVRIDGVRRH